MITKWINNGTGNPSVFQGLTQSPFAPDPVDLEEARKQNKLVLDAENIAKREAAKAAWIKDHEAERANFKPFLMVVPELSRPTSITFYAVTGGLSRYLVALPQDINNWDEKERNEYLKEKIIESFSLHKGRTFFRGVIIGYNFYNLFGMDPLFYNSEGDYIGIGTAQYESYGFKIR